MKITRSGSTASAKGPAEWFTGTVRIDALFSAQAKTRAAGNAVTFEPGARTAWHTHPLGQVLIVTFGAGRVQREGGSIEEVRPGDVVWFEPGEKHWHGASAETAMSHIAIQEALDGKAVDWLEHVTERTVPRPVRTMPTSTPQERTMTRSKSPLIRLNNGIDMPALGLGVYQSPPDQTVSAIETAIANGYRLIDTAAAYLNEREVGEGIVRSGIDRAELFVQTKLWISDYGDRALRGFDASVRKLGLEYVDLYLLHWPMPTEFEATVASYRAAEKLLAEGRVRAIGVCSFSATHVENLRARTEVAPAVNQVELHPFFIQREVREADARHGVVTQSWSPIGGVNVYAARDPNAVKHPLQHQVVVTLAAKYGNTPAQVVLRWHIEHGLSAIPKSVRPERILENIDVFDFALTADEVASIDALDTGVRGGPEPDTVDTKLFTFAIPD